MKPKIIGIAVLAATLALGGWYYQHTRVHLVLRYFWDCDSGHTEARHGGPFTTEAAATQPAHNHDVSDHKGVETAKVSSRMVPG